MPPSITAFDTRDALMRAAADRIAEVLENGLKSRGSACAALSGGATPEPAYRLLAEKSLDWANIIFALVDERFVPPEHEASNEGMLRRALAPALATDARLLPMYSAGPAPGSRPLRRATAALPPPPGTCRSRRRGGRGP
jgi:6-phosphogluconolactonase